MKIATEISIRKKISQLIMPRLEGALLTEPVYFEKIRILVKGGIGGFILFGGNQKDVKRSLEELQAISDIPLLISSDLEQGLGQQVEGGTLFPKSMAIASAIDPANINDLKLLRDAIDIIAYEAREIGINVILSPVLDVNTNPKNPIICTRAFSENPEKVAFFGREFIKGIQSPIATLIACAKHFPGHGDTEIDSHNNLPIIRLSIEKLKKRELYPFIEAIRAGVKMIMVGHLRVQAIDPDRPASLSYKVINDLLRNQLGFNGIVITDAMNMGAIKETYQEREACLMAIKAGVDIILHPEDPESIIENLSSRWEDIELQVEESLKRILKTKKGFGYPVEVQSSKFKVQSRRASLRIAEILSEKAIRVIKGSPCLSEDSMVLILDDDNSGAGKGFIQSLKMKYPALEVIYIDSRNKSSEKARILDKINGKSLTAGIFSKISASKGRSGIGLELYQFLKDALMKSYNSTVISFGSPYILNDIKADTLIAAYGDSEPSQRAVGKLLCENLR